MTAPRDPQPHARPEGPIRRRVNGGAKGAFETCELSRRDGERERPRSARNGGRRETGTAIAILGGTPPDAKHGFVKPSRGGARNRADRVSHGLSARQLDNLKSAAALAWEIGLPFNRHLTIHWTALGMGDGEAARATGRFIKLASDWLRSRGVATAWIWARENGEAKGSHVHILMHVPAGMTLAARQRRWLRLATGRAYAAGAIRTRRIGRSARASETSPASYAANLETVVGYLAKGATPDAAKARGIVRLEYGGAVIGKRAATSQNIGAAARTRHFGTGIARVCARAAGNAVVSQHSGC